MSTLLEGRTTRRSAEPPGPALDRHSNKGRQGSFSRLEKAGRKRKVRRENVLQPGHGNEHIDREAQQRSAEQQEQASAALEQEQQAVAGNSVHQRALQQLTADQLENKRLAGLLFSTQVKAQTGQLGTCSVASCSAC